MAAWIFCPLPVCRRGGSLYLVRQWAWREVLPLFGSVMAIRAPEGSDLVLLQVHPPHSIAVGDFAVALQVSIIPGLAGALINIMLVAGPGRMAVMMATGLIAGAGRSSTSCLISWIGLPAALLRIYLPDSRPGRHR